MKVRDADLIGVEFKVVPGEHEKRTRNDKNEPGFKIAVEEPKLKGKKEIDRKVLYYFYNDGSNNPTRSGCLSFTRGAAKRAENKLNKRKREASKAKAEAEKAIIEEEETSS